MLNASISESFGGFVSFREDHAKDGPVSTLRTIIADLFADIGSRAMERIFQSENPLEPESRLDITTGSSGDLKMATKHLNFLLSFGADLDAGSIARDSEKDYFETLPDERLQKAGLVLRELEDFMVRDFLSAHDQEWFISKVREAAKMGHLTENEFYQLIKYPFPGENAFPIGDISILPKVFGSTIKAPPVSVRRARNYRQGQTRTTASENLDRYIAFFRESVRRHFHPEIIANCGSQLTKLKKTN
jgi:hypothetical protein